LRQGLAMWPGMTSDWKSFCLYLPNAGITGVCYHAKPNHFLLASLSIFQDAFFNRITE
jgi:hypothetical protein